MAMEIDGKLRNEVAKALFNSATLLSFWGESPAPGAIRRQIAECNAVLRKLGLSAMVDGMPERKLMNDD